MGRYHQKLKKLSQPQDRGFSHILDDSEIASNIESVLFPLYSCVQAIQSENPNLIIIPELIPPPQHLSAKRIVGAITGGLLYRAIRGILGESSDNLSDSGSLATAIADSRDIGYSLEHSLKEKRREVYDGIAGDKHDEKDDRQEEWDGEDTWHDCVKKYGEDDEGSARREAEQAVDEQAFDLYCKCRQFIDAAKGKLKPEEVEFLNQVISRTEGASYRKRYDELFHPQRIGREDDRVVKPLVLPDDFLHNPAYFDPNASVIGSLSEKVLKGGGQRFAIFIECLASKSFGYIQPTVGNKRLLAARLSGCKLETSYSEVEWIEKKGRSVSETEKVMLWITNYLYGGGYDRAYEILNFERHVKPGQETANLKNADKILRDRISLLYLNV